MATTGLYSPHVNHPQKRIARNILLAVILILFALLTLFPIFYMIMSSFGPAVATAGTSRSIFPRVWTLDSYKAFFSFSKYSVRWIVNSLIVASATVAGNVIFASMAGYAFSKIRFKGRQWLFGLILVAMMIPYQVTQVPLYILIANKLHMTNTYAAMILPGVVTSYNIFLAKQFFTSIPTPLIESAKLDGCNQLGIFVRIILPLSKTVLAVMAINTFLSSWNTFFWPFLVTSKDYIFTIQVSQDLQVCERDALCPHDGGRDALGAADVHSVLHVAEILPRGRHDRRRQGLTEDSPRAAAKRSSPFVRYGGFYEASFV